MHKVNKISNKKRVYRSPHGTQKHYFIVDKYLLLSYNQAVNVLLRSSTKGVAVYAKEKRYKNKRSLYTVR